MYSCFYQDYASFVIIEISLHLIPGKRRPADRKKAILADVLQLPLSYFFTVLLNDTKI